MAFTVSGEALPGPAAPGADSVEQGGVTTRFQVAIASIARWRSLPTEALVDQ